MVKVLIYEDNPPLREGLTMLIDGTEGFQVLGAFHNCTNMGLEVGAYKPDVILMDVDMLGINGLEGLRMVRQKNTSVSILMLTVLDENKNIFEALQHGANGYILKNTPPAKLLEYVLEASTGGAPMTATIASQVLKVFSQINKPDHHDYLLSEKETQVLNLLVKGCSYKMVAAKMFLPMDSLRRHIKSIIKKLHFHSKSEGVAKPHRDILE